MGPIVSMQDVSLRYHSLSGETPAVSHLSFTVEPGEFISIVGPSGCGKSTILSMLAGQLPPSEGNIDVNGHIGYMLQKDLLLPWRTIEDNVALARTLRGEKPAKVRPMARDMMRKCGLEGFAKARPGELSGGMRQRAALMRTLLTGREVLLLDEPFGALDAITRLQLQLLLCDLWQETGKTILLVTHDVDEALLLSDEIIVLTQRPGQVREKVQVTLPRPRKPEHLAMPEAAALKAHLLSLLWTEDGKEAAQDA